MSRHERGVRGVQSTSELVRRLSDDVVLRSTRRRKRRQRTVGRIIKAAIGMFLVTFVIIPTMIAAGFLLGPHGTEGLIAAPLLLLTSWAAILYWAFGRRQHAPPQRLPEKTELSSLPAQTDDWLDEQRRFLPHAAHAQLDSIGVRLEALSVQLQGVTNDKPAAAELQRLLSRELPELVSGYRKVPRSLQRQPLHGGSSPERQLLDGLSTIDQQIGRMHEQLAADDLHALATHQRFLDLKYKRDDDELK